jgi:hypothetical protein
MRRDLSNRQDGLECERLAKRLRGVGQAEGADRTMEDGVRAGAAARGVPQRMNSGTNKAPVKKMTISLKKGNRSSNTTRSVGLGWNTPAALPLCLVTPLVREYPVCFARTETLRSAWH